MRWTRREVLRQAGAGVAALLLGSPKLTAADDAPAFQLPKLPYDYDALEPHIDAETMKIHHDLHHGAYVTGLNAALKGHEALAKKGIVAILRNIEQVPMEIRTAVINMGGGHANHSMFWEIMAKKSGQPSAELARAIDDAFGSLDKLQAKINEAGLKQFGSGWTWLVLDQGKLAVLSTANQNSPYMNGQLPILGNDIWEHAYYLKYRNQRAAYLKAWWNVVNWDEVSARYQRALKAS